MTASPDLGQVEEAVRDLPDPEIPVISIDDLGIVRAVQVVAPGAGAPGGRPRVRVTITPTYSGCPAIRAIADAIERTVRRHGGEPEVLTSLSPPWTTDWMSPKGKESLRRFGIAPPRGVQEVAAPGSVAAPGPVVVDLSVRRVDCPQCGSADTEELARFGSTACKALRRCRTCREPFEEFKTL